MRKYFGAIAFAFLFAFFALLSSAGADNFPSRPITLIVRFPPGGSTDVAARIMADKMCAALGQVVIVENVGGAGGSIGVGRLARAAPDGYTITSGNGTRMSTASFTILITTCAPISRRSS